MLSIACREIVMSEAATIGDSQAITIGSDGSMEVAPEKSQTVVATTFEKYAQRNGYPIPVVIGMVRANLEIVRYRKPVDPNDPGRGSTWAYYRSDQLPSWSQQEAEHLTDQEIVVPKDEIATFPAFKAIEYGLCSRLEPDVNALVESIRAPDAAVRAFEWSWAENASRWLLSMRVWLFLAGAVFAYVAIKMPGTGVPELLAVLCFGLFFGASAIAGFAGPLEMVLFFLGVGLLLLEIFVLPGFGVAGFAGLACIFLSIALAAIPAAEGDVEPVAPSRYLLPMATHFVWGLLGAIVVCFLLARFLPRVPLFRGLALEGPQPSRPPAAPGPAAPPVGARGMTETPLRPAGRAFVDGQHRDVVAEGAFVPQGVAVRVVAVRGNVVVVRPETPAVP
jgi:membrane-bound serine protease (ClpP class)